MIGLYSKKEGAGHVALGCEHVHSSMLGPRDPCAVATVAALRAGSIPVYVWERQSPLGSVKIRASRGRRETIRTVVDGCGVASRRELREKLETVCEELVSNALFHAYRNVDGTPRFRRRQAVELAEAEAIGIEYRGSEEGVLLSVADRGGLLHFPTIRSCFERCYGASHAQIDNKEGGAGLGLYMVFEAVAHMKIVTQPGVQTKVSVWLPDRPSHDRDHFSFNFFERGK